MQRDNRRLDAFRLEDGRIVAQGDRGGREQLDDRGGDQVDAQVKGQGEGLDDEMVAVAVDDQARQAVGLGPDEAAQGGIDAEARAEFGGLFDAAAEKFGVEVLAAAREAAGDDLRAGVVDGTAERVVAEVLEG